MISTFVIAVALAIGAGEPVPTAPITRDTVPTYPAPGGHFGIPCKMAALPPEIVGVELWFSDNGGKTWAKSGLLLRDQSQFEFRAPKAGEYLFATRLCVHDGSTRPERDKDLVPEMRVVVGSVSERPKKASREAATVEELDDELTRVELELIRKELKSLSELKGFNPKTEEKIDRLRARLLQARERLRADQKAEIGPALPHSDHDFPRAPTPPPAEIPRAFTPQTGPPLPSLPPPFGPSRMPGDAGSRASAPLNSSTPDLRPVAPMPHAPERP